MKQFFIFIFILIACSIGYFVFYKHMTQIRYYQFTPPAKTSVEHEKLEKTEELKKIVEELGWRHRIIYQDGSELGVALNKREFSTLEKKKVYQENQYEHTIKGKYDLESQKMLKKDKYRDSMDELQGNMSS